MTVAAETEPDALRVYNYLRSRRPPPVHSGIVLCEMTVAAETEPDALRVYNYLRSRRPPPVHR